MYQLKPAKELYEMTIDYSAEEEFWDALMSQFETLAAAHQQFAHIRILANVCIDMNVETTLKMAGYDVDFVEYDPDEDTYTLQVFWDKIAVTGQGVRRQLELVEDDWEEYDE